MNDSVNISNPLTQQVIVEMVDILRKEGGLPEKTIVNLEKCDLIKPQDVINIINSQEVAQK